MQSKAATVDAYLGALPANRRATLQAVREVILQNLDGEYEEGMQYGMIGYYVPHRVYPAGYHCDPRQPLPFAGLAAQKSHFSLYLMCVYGNAELDAWFRTAWAATGRKLDMGKSCIRFKKLEDVPLDVIGETIARVPAKKYIAYHETVLSGRSKDTPAKAGKPETKSAAKPKAAARRSSAPAGKTSAKRVSAKPTRAAKATAAAKTKCTKMRG